MADDRQGVQRIAVDEHIEPDQLVSPPLPQLVVEGGVPLGDALELVVEVVDHFGQGQLVLDDDARLRRIADRLLGPALVLAQLEDRADVLLGDVDRGADVGLLDVVEHRRVRHRRGVVDHHLLAVGGVTAVLDRRRGHDQVEIVFALQALLDDLEVQQP